MTKNKKIVIIIASVVALLAIIAGVFLGIAAYSYNKFWSSYDTLKKVSIEGYDDKVNEILEMQDEVNDLMYNSKDKYSTELSDSDKKSVEICNRAIVDYFNGIYGIDVSSRFDGMEVVRHDFSYIWDQYGISLGGVCFSDDGHRLLYISNEYNEYDFRGTYIHEALHYIGFEDEYMQYVFEGITDYLVSSVIAYSRIDVSYFSSYYTLERVATQLVDADDELISKILTNENYSLMSEIDAKLGYGYGEDMNNAFYLQSFEIDQSKMEFYMQYLMAEYIKTISGNAKEIVYRNNIYAENVLEFKWFFE